MLFYPLLATFGHFFFSGSMSLARVTHPPVSCGHTNRLIVLLNILDMNMKTDG